MKKRRKRRKRNRRKIRLTNEHRYIYIMKRTTNRSFYAKITGQHEYKIGIAKNPETRRKQVDKAIKGNVKLVQVYLAPHAMKLEQELHEIFGDSRFTIQAIGNGAGETEWFYMSNSEYFALEASMWMGWAEQIVAPTLYQIIILILIITYGQKILIGS